MDFPLYNHCSGTLHGFYLFSAYRTPTDDYRLLNSKKWVAPFTVINIQPYLCLGEMERNCLGRIITLQYGCRCPIAAAIAVVESEVGVIGSNPESSSIVMTVKIADSRQVEIFAGIAWLLPCAGVATHLS